MHKTSKSLLLLSVALLCLIVTSCRSKKDVITQKAEKSYSTPYRARKYEMRATWWPTVYRMQYASMSREALQDDMRRKLDLLRDAGFNTIIFQIRPESDAWYRSSLEPWSRFFTGVQGRAPMPEWDPLAFMIEECHKRCLELHAWINPYRAATVKDLSQLGALHPYRRHPDWFIFYNGNLLYNPALPQSRAHICAVVKDIVSRYDVDAIHLDDYFYPYPAPGVPFPDREAFAADPRGFSSIGEWRRDNVNLLMRDLNMTIKGVKPYVRLGISPFGIYRNQKSWSGGSRTNGLQNYDDLYADVLAWDQKGYVDYIMPQIYWEMGHPAADYTELAYWWGRNIKNAHYYIGEDVVRTMKPNQLHPKLIIANESAQGVCMWPSEEVWNNHKNVYDLLRHNYWKYPALPPAYRMASKPYEDPNAILFPHVRNEAGHPTLAWIAGHSQALSERPRYFVVYCYDRSRRDKDLSDPADIVAITPNPYYKLPVIDGKTKVTYRITMIDRNNVEHASKEMINAVL